jgi:hypothetical protein
MFALKASLTLSLLSLLVRDARLWFGLSFLIMRVPFGSRPLIFVGSSMAAAKLKHVQRVQHALRSIGGRPMPWYDAEMFPPGESTWESLLKGLRYMHGAVFVFRGDDLVYRGGARARITQTTKRISLADRRTRDNVVLEFGLACGVLGPDACAICREANTTLPTDLSGITYINLRATDKTLTEKLSVWIKRLPPPTDHFSFLDQREIESIVKGLSLIHTSYGRSKEILSQLGVLPEYFDDHFGVTKS